MDINSWILFDSFDSLGDKIDRVSKAYQQICLTHYTKPAFANNIMIAYDILAQSKGWLTCLISH